MRTLTALLLTLAVVAGWAACGDDDTTESAGGTGTSATSVSTATSEQAMDMDTDHESFAFGEPADAADADRTIDVDMLDALRFEPDSIEVKAGETVAFRLHNSGAVVHEFVIGDTSLQEEHEQEMQEMESGMMMADEPNAVAVEPGATKELAFHFTKAGELQYACHQPGHFAGGMIGTLTVSE